LTQPRRSAESLRDAVIGVGEALSAGFQQASATPFNVEIGPHRRFDWLRFDLAQVKEVKKQLAGP